MGNLSNYESNEIGQARMETLRGFGGKCETVVNEMYRVAVEYNNFRTSISADVEDVAYSDQALVYMVGQLKPVIDSLNEEQKGWLDQVMGQLGYSPSV